MIYHNDENGETLRRMQAEGDDLTRPRDIDFTVVFADESSAEQFAEHIHALGYAASVDFT
jgi:Regulator of ribonuclease activity B